MHVRPHLDCDMIYHIPVKTREMINFDSSRTLNYQMNSLESTQYQAALAVTGAWKGTSRTKIYDELGWETLDHRRIFRRLTQFYKIMIGLTPEYLRIPIPLLRGHLFGCTVTQMSLIPYFAELIDIKVVFSQMVLLCGMIWVRS